MLLLDTTRYGITLRASNYAEFARLIVIWIILLKHFFVAAEVLADHFKIGAFLAVLLNIIIVDLSVTATGSILALDR